MNILLYEQYSRVNLGYYLNELQFSTQTSLSIGTLHTVCVHLLGASFERS